jgi:hypothetical protein
VTTQNIREVTSDVFLEKLSDRGCKAVIYVEYVPVTEESTELAPGDAERKYLRTELARRRKEHPEMVYVSFPGDEKSSGGCVAAGRGFFHINSHGGAEPCPFSPYSDVNVRDTSLRAALHSGLFRALREEGHLLDALLGKEQKKKVETAGDVLAGRKPEGKDMEFTDKLRRVDERIAPRQPYVFIDEDEEKGTGLPAGEIQQQETMYNTWSKLSKQLAEKFAAERQERVSSITD